MRLTDLNPRWLRAIADPESQGYGVEFDCPCDGAPGCPRRIWLMFANPISGPVSRLGATKWKRGGDTFEELTVDPSIHHVGPDGVTHWHGWLHAGAMVPC